MNVQLHWFGIAWAASTLLALVPVLVVVFIGLGRVRRADPLAGLLVASAGALEGVALAGELLVRGTIASMLRSVSEEGLDLSLGLLDAWTIGRPLLHVLALAALCVALARLTAQR